MAKEELCLKKSANQPIGDSNNSLSNEYQVTGRYEKKTIQKLAGILYVVRVIYAHKITVQTKINPRSLLKFNKII